MLSKLETFASAPSTTTLWNTSNISTMFTHLGSISQLKPSDFRKINWNNRVWGCRRNPVSLPRSYLFTFRSVCRFRFTLRHLTKVFFWSRSFWPFCDCSRERAKGDVTQELIQSLLHSQIGCLSWGEVRGVEKVWRDAKKGKKNTQKSEWVPLPWRGFSAVLGGVWHTTPPPAAVKGTRRCTFTSRCHALLLESVP